MFIYTNLPNLTIRFVQSRPTDYLGVMMGHVARDFDASDSDDDDEIDDQTRADAAALVAAHRAAHAAKTAYEPGAWNVATVSLRESEALLQRNGLGKEPLSLLFFYYYLYIIF